ncbi:MAG: hypothetical protein HY075_06955 [Deltaproteobacteria bacterium]|nr:hypothetical protein [Deltaproteobacteria bacterium]
MTTTIAFTLGLLLAAPSSFATDVYVDHGKLRVEISDSQEAYDLFTKLHAQEIPADQGFYKRVEIQDGKDSLSLLCSFDHRSSCAITYENVAGRYFAGGDNSGVFLFSSAFATRVYEALDIPAATGWGSSRKIYITADGRFELSCSWYQKAPAPSCMLEVIKSR